MPSFRSRLGLVVLSGILLGASFPPSPFHVLAYIGLVPLLWALEGTEKRREMIRLVYIGMVVFHAITLYWVGGFVHLHDKYLMVSGLGLMFIHPLFYFIPIGLYRIVRKRLGLVPGLAAFPFLFVAYEYSHALGEFSFPWLTLGNSQASNLAVIQMAEYTSVYGISMQILLFNVIAFYILKQLREGTFGLRTRRFAVLAGTLTALFVLPLIYGAFVVVSLENRQPRASIKTIILQPNIDPWEKWGEGTASKWDSYERQFRLLITSTRKAVADSRARGENPALVVWPETAIPFYITLPQNQVYWDILRAEFDAMHVALFTGLPYAEFLDSAHASVTSARIRGTNEYYDAFNAATLIEPGRPVTSFFRKTVLVPFAERIPYADKLSFLIEPLKWGVGISSWGIGKEYTVFPLHADSSVIACSGVICYESMYPDFVRRFAANGAEVLMVITNDSWYGNTSGPYQLAACASLRAVETRRSIIRSANGGISCFIDHTGRQVQPTAFNTRAALSADVAVHDEQTFYIRHGDIFVQVCSAIALLTLAAALFSGVRNRKSKEVKP